MNRPFCAFGILLGLLVLTTLGVSSSTRSTQVRAIPVKAIQQQARRCGGSTFILVLPDARCAARSCSIAAAQVELAGEIAAFDRTLDPMDCRSHGDAAYDYAVYGDRDSVAPANTTEAPAMAYEALNAEELVGIFREMASTARKSSSCSPALRQWIATQLRPALFGLQNWSWRQFERLPLSWLVTGVAMRPMPATSPVTWSDYTSFADSISSQAPSPQSAKVELAAQENVQSGHWLLHSAASSLNHLALLLQAAADRLEQPAKIARTN